MAPAQAAQTVSPSRNRALKIIKGTLAPEEKFMKSHDEVAEVIGVLRDMGCVIAFTSGNWDLFHIGHARYIAHGRSEAVKHYPNADHIIMVVGVDTDEMTRKRKGINRPIVPEGERAEIVAQLQAVDIVVPQNEPDQLFRLIKHDVRIVSMSTKDLPAIELIQSQCKHVVNLPPQAETSTTARVRRLAIDGVYERLMPYLGKLKPIVDEMMVEVEKVQNELQSK